MLKSNLNRINRHLPKFTKIRLIKTSFKNITQYRKVRKFESDSYKKYNPPQRDLFEPSFPSIMLPTRFQKEQKWTKKKTRMGAIGVKMGCISIWDGHGVIQPCTVIKFDNLQIIKIHNFVNKLDLAKVVLGCGQKNWNRIDPCNRRLFEEAGVAYKAHLKEFQVSKDGLAPVGTAITVRHFLPGQLVDAKSTTF
ncbi:hypothetical protein MHBO_004901 [Bonamia ostreae]|uniref:Ribosomal protein L14 n=1 Tax=Bonamia ostreae TaxID=126728 RepID=A0ABV2AUK6_9EUKA